MKNLTKKALFCVAIFSFVFTGVGFATENNTEDAELRERLDMLIEKANEIIEIAQELDEKGELPLEEDEDCDKYLTTYIGYGRENKKEEVERLQIFLNDHMGKEIPVTGFYGEITMNAVKEFQGEYAGDVLDPWGIQEPTGYVYKTTQRMINDIMCPDVHVPMPENLVPDRTVEHTVPEDVEEDVVVDEEAHDGAGNNMTAQVVGDGEDAENGDEAEEIDENEESLLEADLGQAAGNGDGRSVTWTILILASIGLGMTLYYIYTGKKEPKRA